MSIFCNWAFFPSLFSFLFRFVTLLLCLDETTHLDFGGDFTPITFGDHIADLFVNFRIANLTHFYSSFGYMHKIVDFFLSSFLLLFFFFLKGCGNLYYKQDVFINITVVGIVQQV